MATFLSLVNDLIRESGQDGDSITDFSNLTPMQTRFKGWIAQSWKEICMERDEWEYMTGKAVRSIYPRIRVEDWTNAGGVPVQGALFAGQDSGFSFTLFNTEAIEGTITDPNGLSAFIDISGFSTANMPFLDEMFDQDSPVNLAGTFVFKGWGKYNLNNYSDTVVTSGVSYTFTSVEPQLDTLYIQDVETGSTNLQKVTYIPYARFIEMAPEYGSSLGKPQVFTTCPDGTYDMWPRPDKRYVITYEYTKNVTELVNETDVPAALPSEYHDAIMWRALTYFADYDEDTAQFRTATKRYNFYKNRMERRLMPVVSFGRNKFNYE